MLDGLEPLGVEEEDRYVPNQNEILFTKSKWSFDGQDSFEDYVVRIGGYARTLGVGEICFKIHCFNPSVLLAHLLYQIWNLLCLYTGR